MNPIAKVLIIAGASLMILGLLWQFGGKSLHLGRLPGDIAIERDHFKFYFPITTSILFSILFSAIAYFFRSIKK
jgi:hypothetical protein